MRRIGPIGGSKSGKLSRVRKQFGRMEEALKGMQPQQFQCLKRHLADGSYLKTITINRPGLAPLRISRLRDADDTEGGILFELFLESGWVHVLAGDVPGELFYSDHLSDDYAARNTIPPYLDWMVLPGPLWRVREYSAWMPSMSYGESHGQNLDVAGNKFAHSGKLAKLTRCVLGSLFDNSLFKDFLELPGSTELSYILQTDSNGDYWLVRIRRNDVYRAKLLWYYPGDIIHAQIKKDIGGNMDRFSAAHRTLRGDEAYLFACAKNVSTWEHVGDIDIAGSAKWYGWNANWRGDEIVHVTLETIDAGATLDGIRGRLYEMTLDDTVVSVELVEDEIGTPSDTMTAVYYPDTFAVPQRMNAVFWKSHLIDWTNAQQSDEFPVYAAYKSKQGEDDEYFEVWNEHETVPNDATRQNYHDTKYNARPLCGAGNKELIIYTSGTNRHHKNGFYTKKAPGGNDKNFVKESQNQGLTYRLTWNVEDTGSDVVCTDSPHAFGSTRAYNGYNCTCGIWPPEPPGVCWNNGTYVNFGDSPICSYWHPAPVTFTIAYAQITEITYPHLNSIAHSALVFNYNDPESVTLLRYYYDRQSSVTKRTKGYNCISHYHTDYLKPTDSDTVFDFGSYNGIWSYPGTHIRGTGFVWPGDTPAYDALQWVEDDTGPYTEGSSHYEVEIEHVLVTGKEVIKVLKETYDDWDDTGDYQGALTPLRTYPYYDAGIFCKAPTENYVASGNLIDLLPITDTAIPDERLGMLLMPVGRV